MQTSNWAKVSNHVAVRVELAQDEVAGRGLSSAIGTRLSRFSHSSFVLFALKGFNSASPPHILISFWPMWWFERSAWSPSRHRERVCGCCSSRAERPWDNRGGHFKLRSHYLGETGKHAAGQDAQSVVVTIVTPLHRDRRHSVAILGIALAAGLVQWSCLAASLTC